MGFACVLTIGKETGYLQVVFSSLAETGDHVHGFRPSTQVNLLGSEPQEGAEHNLKT